MQDMKETRETNETHKTDEHGETFSTLSNRFWEKLKGGVEIVLATSDGMAVTARTVSAAAAGGKLCFITHGESLKIAQMRKNANVSLCHGDIRMKGSARIAGSPKQQGNECSIDALAKAFPDSVPIFSCIPGTVLVEITPVAGGFGTLNDGGIFTLDFETQSARKLDIGV